MATKPTRIQQRAVEDLALALHLIAKAARAEGGGQSLIERLDELSARIADVSSVFDRDEIVARALRLRVEELGLPQDAYEMLTLLDSEVRLLDLLLESDEVLREHVAQLERDLGEP